MFLPYLPIADGVLEGPLGPVFGTLKRVADTLQLFSRGSPPFSPTLQRARAVIGSSPGRERQLFCCVVCPTAPLFPPFNAVVLNQEGRSPRAVLFFVIRSAFRGLGLPSLMNDPEHWKQRARETRLLAETVDDPQAKAEMLEVADEYERLPNARG